ncbi:MAG TPA: ABC transporter substrate-binding protein [Candidatus Binatia bacterium]|nr:ABC transporter substrate-binding protein [Candidatus Binatia bacterium]
MRYKAVAFVFVTLALISFHLAEAQQPTKVSRLGVLRSSSSPTNTTPDADGVFRQRLRELGWMEGQNISIELRRAEGKFERLPHLASELVRKRLDVIYAGDFNAAVAAKQSTTTIPVVFQTLGDPVASGLVPDLARPGGNLTGVAGLGPELSGKRLELLKEVIPGLTRVAFLTDPSNIASAATVRETERAAQSLGLQLQIINVTNPHQLEPAFLAMKKNSAKALMVNHDPTLTSQRRRILSLVESARLPAAYVETLWISAGGLMTYGPNLFDQNRRVATYVDKILKGAKPGELPVEQPTKFELTINLKAAKQIGLTIPPTVLARADKIIK